MGIPPRFMKKENPWFEKVVSIIVIVFIFLAICIFFFIKK